MNTSSEAAAIYCGSNGGATRSFCSGLEKNSQLGRIAAELFRTQKASSRAKRYRGGIKHRNGGRTSYRDLAYQRKELCLERLCDLLVADDCGMCWGWSQDPKQLDAPHVLYVNLPQGQVSFHSPERYAGPAYTLEWDGSGKSERRIIELCDSI